LSLRSSACAFFDVVLAVAERDGHFGLGLDAGELDAGDGAEVFLLEVELHQIDAVHLDEGLLDVAVFQGEGNRLAGLEDRDLVHADALFLEVADRLGGIGVEVLDLRVPFDGCGGLALGVVDLAEDVAGEVAVLAVAVGDHARGGERLAVLVLPEQPERGHVLEPGASSLFGVAAGELAAELDNPRIVPSGRAARCTG
jgi:hypothetical protein